MKRRVIFSAISIAAFAGSFSLASAAWSHAGMGSGGSDATTVAAGNEPSATATRDTVHLSWDASTLTNGEPVTGYIVKRYDSSGTEQQVISSGTCASVVSVTTCSETSVPSGTWRYSVTPVFNNWRGVESTKTSVNVDAEAPATTITFPSSGSTYNDDGYRSGCGTASTGDLCGTAADTGGSGIKGVEVSVRQGSGSYWDGSAFQSATEVWFAATGTTEWSLVFSASDFDAEGSYTVRARAIDNASNVGTADSATFAVDRTPPPSPTITSSPPTPTSSTSATFEFVDPEAGVVFECRLDGSAYSSCSSPETYAAVNDGTHAFDVRALDEAGNASSPASHTWTVDTTPPAAAISFPINGSRYNDARYTAGCGTSSVGDFCGTSGDAGSGVVGVQVSIRQTGGKYWDGTKFRAATEVWFDATGTTDWSYVFPATDFPAEGGYELRVKATDAAGNVSLAPSPFEIDRTAPSASDVQTANVGAPGKAEMGDTISLTYSEPIEPSSLMSGWDGSSASVVVRITNGVGGNDTLTVWNATNAVRVDVGSVNLGRSDYVTSDVTFGVSGTASTMTQDGQPLGTVVRVVLGTPSDTSSIGRAGAGADMVWSPSSPATDYAGNACSTTAKIESGAKDRDF